LIKGSALKNLMNQKEELKNVLINAVKEAVGNETKVVLFFSGGLDSAIIGKILTDLRIKVFPVTVGIEGSEDIKFAENAADIVFNGLPAGHLIVNLSKKNVEEAVKKVIQITGSTDIVTVSVGIVSYLAARGVFPGYKIVFTGSGSDELFCGYSSHKKALECGWDAVHAECIKRFEGIKKDIDRDENICKHFGLDVKTPFLDKKVVEISLKMPPKLKISENENKIVLREIAEELKLPEFITKRGKKAAQYSSGSQKILKKLSKENGFRTTDEYLMSVYKQVYKK
jgi:asparagine synthase (glutamine-hydrolysing)